VAKSPFQFLEMESIKLLSSQCNVNLFVSCAEEERHLSRKELSTNCLSKWNNKEWKIIVREEGNRGRRHIYVETNWIYRWVH
jgi:hypothetical protein